MQINYLMIIMPYIQRLERIVRILFKNEKIWNSLTVEEQKEIMEIIKEEHE